MDEFHEKILRIRDGVGCGFGLLILVLLLWAYLVLPPG